MRRRFLMLCILVCLAVLCACSRVEQPDTTQMPAQTLPQPQTEGLILHYDMLDYVQGSQILEDKSGNGNHAALFGSYQVEDGALFLENGGYAQLPTGLFDGKDTLTISLWLNNYTGPGNYSAMFFGTGERMPVSYWLLNPCNPAGTMKSVVTNGVNPSAPYGTEVGISASAGQTVQGPTTGIGWNLYTTVITGDSITAYFNGEKVGTQAVSRAVSDFGTGLLAYLGKSSYNDPPYMGFIRGVKVYNRVLKDEDIAAEYAAGAPKVESFPQSEYPNPLIEERADPYIILGQDGYYYFTASYPMRGTNDPEGYDRVILRRSRTLEGLADAQEITIWDESESDQVFRYIWAPELHYIGGSWYVFFAGSTSRSSVWDIRCHVLVCDSQDPYTGNWRVQGRFQPSSGDTFSFRDFSLDMTYFENNGTHYVIWAQKSGASNLYMATIDPTQPWILTSMPMTLAVPEYYWEKARYYVCEGPSVLKHDGNVFVCYSAAGTGPEYCIGLLTAAADADLMDPDSWTKGEEPLLTSLDLYQEYGPGHNSFTVDENGDYVFVYHARSQACFEGKCGFAGQDPLVDPCRHARLRKVLWSKDGTPILNGVPEESA